MSIGRMFSLETVGERKQGYPQNLGSDVRYCMSGRCALYYCILDIPTNEGLRLAYVPAYTCETVLGSYEKAGYSCRFYDVDPNELKPRFREEDMEGVSVFGLSGYYGFSTYDKSFVRICKDRGIVILQDTTHTPFEPASEADYLAGSLRKWMGIACGGIAVKREGSFSADPLPVDEEHLQGRYAFMDLAAKAEAFSDPLRAEKAREVFWENELGLRKSFDAFGSDDLSRSIIDHFPYDFMITRRRDNYKHLLDRLEPPKGWSLAFPTLQEGATPSHLSVYAEDRDRFMSYLNSEKIGATVYWPVPPRIDDIERYPGAHWVYNHICSIQIDQRYKTTDMIELAACLNSYSRRVSG